MLFRSETGELIHPRLERQERGLPELPDLPLAYAADAAFPGVDGAPPVLYPVEAEAYESPSEPDPGAPAPRRLRPGRRLASGKRAAK